MLKAHLDAPVEDEKVADERKCSVSAQVRQSAG